MDSEVSATARALRTLELLRTRPGSTAAEIGRELGVTERAARRYVAILREAQIPVHAIRGRYGGYRLGRGARLPPVTFTEAEALGLVMTALEGGGPIATDGPIDTALHKVIRALPDVVASQAAMVRRHAAAAPDPYASRPEGAVVGDLVSAVARHRQLRLTYRSTSGRSWETTVDPWAVVARYGRWYLLCHAEHVDQVRTYRADRIVAAHETGASCKIPANLNPVAELEAHLAQGWEYPTRVVFHAPRDEVAGFVRPPMGTLSDHPEGCVLEGSTSNPVMYAGEWLAAIPVPMRVEGGTELNEAMAALAGRLSAAVDGGASAGAGGPVSAAAPGRG